MASRLTQLNCIVYRPSAANIYISSEIENNWLQIIY